MEKKINLENAHYEELMLELQLKKGKSGLPTTLATVANFTGQATTTAAGGSGPPPLTTMASFEGYMTDSSIGNHQPMITISQPNGKRGIVVALPRLAEPNEAIEASRLVCESG